MVLQFLKIKNSVRGITLVEVIVTIFIITLFSGMIISDFPMIKKRLSLSLAIHKLAQDIRKAQDLGLSGIQIVDIAGESLPVKGFGLYININPIDGNNKEYLIYGDKNGNQQYDSLDYGLDLIDMDKESKGVVIKGIYNALENRVSINFSPPNPKTTIFNLESGLNRVKIVLALEDDNSVSREVYVYTSGLIEVK